MVKIIRGKPISRHYIRGSSAISGNDFEEKVIFKFLFFYISKCTIGSNPQWKTEMYYKKSKKQNLPFKYWYYSDYLKFYKIYV